jgi:hypothetical protein
MGVEYEVQVFDNKSARPVTCTDFIQEFAYQMVFHNLQRQSLYSFIFHPSTANNCDDYWYEESVEDLEKQLKKNQDILNYAYFCNRDSSHEFYEAFRKRLEMRIKMIRHLIYIEKCQNDKLNFHRYTRIYTLEQLCRVRDVYLELSSARDLGSQRTINWTFIEMVAVFEALSKVYDETYTFHITRYD